MHPRKSWKILLLSICCLLASVTARAQFVLSGNEPGKVKWMQISSAHYQVIYPKGLDSLANAYALSLESFYEPVSRSTGFKPMDAFKKPTPVLLRPFTSVSNGLVSLTPRRMELYTTPDTGPMPDEHIGSLVSHESRHLSQMQFTHLHQFKPLRWILGDLGPSAIYMLYTERSLLEGDAVVAETALGEGGRGRSANFLNYFHASLSEGQNRSWWQWRYGSLKRYTPDFYALGYITMAGVRTVWDEPRFPQLVTDRLWAKGLPFFNFPKTVKDISGLKFRDAFTQITDSLAREWAETDRLRGPFQPMSQVTPDCRYFNSYDENVALDGGGHYIIRGGVDRPTDLVFIKPNGKQKRLRAFSANVSNLSYGDETHPLIWTEYNPDPRWEMKSNYNIRYMDEWGRFHNVTRGGKYYFPQYKDNLVSAIRLDDKGGSSLDFLNLDGETIESIPAPKGMQFLEDTWVEDNLYVTLRGKKGIGIYGFNGKNFTEILSPVYSNLGELSSEGNRLYFSCDRTGVNELYEINPSDGALYQVTSTPYGGQDWQFAGDILSFCALGPGGQNLFKTPIKDLPRKKVNDMSERFVPSFAATISRQEMEMKKDCPVSTQISSPKPYSKIGNLFRIHSWLPFYVNYDAISDMSFENLFKTVNLGATAFFQNTLGSMSGIAGLKIAPSEGWIPSLEGQFTYTGLYPVMELDFSLGKRCSGTFKTYIPWKWNSGGWLRGVVPQASFSANTTGIQAGDDVYPFTRVNASLRGYVMRPVASSAIYPRLGIGAEVGVSSIPTASGVIKPSFYGLAYAYLPGVIRTHGIKLSALTQAYFGEGKYISPYANTAPRGFPELLKEVSGYPAQMKLTMDYAFPFANVEWDFLSPVAYIRNFEAIVHGDYCLGFGAQKVENKCCGSIGADLAAVLGNFLWIPYDTRIGVSYNYGFGAGHSCSLLFSVDF